MKWQLYDVSGELCCERDSHTQIMLDLSAEICTHVDFLFVDTNGFVYSLAGEAALTGFRVKVIQNETNN